MHDRTPAPGGAVLLSVKVAICIISFCGEGF
jgi:hypothetical protein